MKCPPARAPNTKGCTMTISVTIGGTVGDKEISHVIHLPDDAEALRRVAGKFNPSGDVAIDVAKVLAAASISHVDAIQADVHFKLFGNPPNNLAGHPPGHGEAGAAADRCAEQARAGFEAAVFWAVKAKVAPINYCD